MDKFTSMCFLVLGITMSLVSAEHLDPVARVAAKGKSVYIPVKRELLQEKLDQFGGPKLYMPNHAVFTDQPMGTHPLLIDVAEITFTDFEESEADNPKSYVSTTGIEVTVNIPYLALMPGGPTTYSLGDAVLYDGGRRGIPQPDVLYTYIPVERITVHENGVTVVDGKAEIHIEFVTDTCIDLSAELIEKSDDLVAKLFQKRDNTGAAAKRSETNRDVKISKIDDEPAGMIFTLGSPNMDFCWFYPTGKTQFCDDVDLIKNLVDHFGFNICTTWSSANEKYCQTKAGEVHVSGWFRHLIPIDEATQALFAGQYKGDYNIGLTFPCVNE